MSEKRCKHGMVPDECPVALGIYIDGIRFNGDKSRVYHKWLAVCDQASGVCGRDYEDDEWLGDDSVG